MAKFRPDYQCLSVLFSTVVVLLLNSVSAQVLTPPYFNLAEGRRIVASDTCGEGVPEPELFCKLVGADTEKELANDVNLFQGQVNRLYRFAKRGALVHVFVFFATPRNYSLRESLLIRVSLFFFSIHFKFCDYCDPKDPNKRHPAEAAVDGRKTWWQSPPLSRGMSYNEVNLTIDLGQVKRFCIIFNEFLANRLFNFTSFNLCKRRLAITVALTVFISD